MALHLIKNKIPCTLSFFGGFSNWQYEHIIKQTAKTLHIENLISYEGHAGSIQEAIVNHHVDIAWLISNNDFIGYAAMEIIESGIPVLFFNCGNAAYTEVKEQTGEAIHTFESLEDFTNFSVDLASDAGKRSVLSARQLEFIHEVHDYTKHAESLTHFYNKVINKENL